MADLGELDTAILAAHRDGDGVMLSALYARAAERFDANGETGSACFFYTQAYVFALEAGLQQAERYGALLKARNRL